MYRKMAMGFEADQYVDSSPSPSTTEGDSQSGGGGSTGGDATGGWRGTWGYRSSDTGDGIMKSTKPSAGRPVGSLMGRPFFPAIAAAGDGDIPNSPEQVRAARKQSL